MRVAVLQTRKEGHMVNKTLRYCNKLIVTLPQLATKQSLDLCDGSRKWSGKREHLSIKYLLIQMVIIEQKIANLYGLFGWPSLYLNCHFKGANRINLLCTKSFFF